MTRKKAPFKKELRISFSPEHYSRLEKQANLLDQTASALVRMWAMEKVTSLEALRSQSGAVDLLRTMSELTEKMEESRE